MALKSFHTHAPSEDEFLGSEPLQFKIDDDVFTAHPPTTGQFAMMMASQAAHKTLPEQISAFIDFFDGMLDPDDRDLFRRRLMDRNDHLEFEMLQEIVEWMVEEWSDRPTLSPSDSSTSRGSTGRASTAKRRGKAST